MDVEKPAKKGLTRSGVADRKGKSPGRPSTGLRGLFGHLGLFRTHQSSSRCPRVSPTGSCEGSLEGEVDGIAESGPEKIKGAEKSDDPRESPVEHRDKINCDPELVRRSTGWGCRETAEAQFETCKKRSLLCKASLGACDGESCIRVPRFFDGAPEGASSVYFEVKYGLAHVDPQEYGGTTRDSVRARGRDR